MRLSIRRGVFETNSSSTHSVTVHSKNAYIFSPTSLIIDEIDRKVHVRAGEFGWEVRTYSQPSDKLSYLCMMLLETEGRNVSSIKELYDSDGFERINTMVASVCECEGISLEDCDLKFGSYDYTENGEKKTRTYLEHEGYIDHQSCEDYSSVQDFLDDYGVSAEEFVFDAGVVLHTSNDNM